MSVLVKGMEKPEHCGYCRFRYDGICHALQRTQYSMDECPLIDEDVIKAQSSAQPEHDDGEMFWKNRAKEYESLNAELLAKFYDGIKIDSITINENEVVFGGSKPERNKGKWINNSPVTMKCDQCGYVIKDWRWNELNFCANCGADMRGENNETD